MKTNALEVHFDYETRSEADIRKVGAYLYATHPSTEIICMSYKIGEGQTKLWTPDGENDSIQNFLDCTIIEGVKLKAHNALFEYYISNYVLPKVIGKRWPGTFAIEKFRCTAAKAAACSLPRQLGKVGAALNLPLQKDKRGDALIKRYCKPRQAWTKWKLNGRVGKEPEKYFYDEDDYNDFYSYCRTDTDVEYLLDKRLPDLTPSEQKVWELNATANARGVTIDVPTVKQILILIDEYTKRLTKESKEICGFNITQRNKVLEWCRENGAAMVKLDKQAITEALENDSVGTLNEKVRRVLEIRQSLSKSSTKKYQTMLIRTSPDSRARDLSLYHGASTGRESGTGIQFQNLPKGSIKNPEEIIERIQKTFSSKFFGQWDPKNFNNDLELEYGSPLEIYSSLVRGMITASKSKRLFLADYNAIEARVLAWLCGQKDLLNQFAGGEDLYVKAASDIYGISEARVTKAQRQFGKTVVLACGFGQGHNGLFRVCQLWGVEATLDLCKKAVRVYRSTNYEIVKTWYGMEKAIIHAIKNKVTVRYKGVTFSVRDGFLWCQLPSGRKLAYYNPSVRNKPSFGGVMKPTIFFWAEHPKTKKWVEHSFWHGAIIENLVQAIARDITVEAMQRCEAKGYQYLFMVHDEINSESERGSAKEYKQLLEQIPRWAKGLPLTVESEESFRYKK